MIFIIILLAFTGLLQAAGPIRVSVDVSIGVDTEQMLRTRLTGYILKELRNLPDIEITDYDPDFMLKFYSIDSDDGYVITSTRVVAPLGVSKIFFLAETGLDERDKVSEKWKDRIREQIEMSKTGVQVTHILTRFSNEENGIQSLIMILDASVFEPKRQSPRIFDEDDFIPDSQTDTEAP